MGSNAFPQQGGIEPPPGCRYECRLVYDTIEEEVTEQECKRKSKKVCQPDTRYACEWHAYEACTCRSTRECTPVEVDECYEVPDVHKFIYYVEEPIQVSVQVCEKVYKDNCVVRQLPQECETVQSCDVTKREPFPEKCTVETYKDCTPVHKKRTRQITKRLPYLTCDGQLDGEPRQYSDEEIFNIQAKYPEARRCAVSNIPANLLPEPIPDVIDVKDTQVTY